MARIAGVDLPRNKRIEISLTYIFGIGRVKALEICEKANLDPGSRFCFRGIPPGTYSLQASGQDVASRHHGHVTLKENQIIDDIEIVIPLSGKLKIVVGGLKDIENMDIKKEVFGKLDEATTPARVTERARQCAGSVSGEARKEEELSL